MVMPTRFWAAYNDKNNITCEDYLKVLEPKNLTIPPADVPYFCKKFALGEVANLGNISTLVMAA